MEGSIVGAMIAGIVLGAAAAVAVLVGGGHPLLALLAYSAAGALGLVGAAALAALRPTTAEAFSA